MPPYHCDYSISQCEHRWRGRRSWRGVSRARPVRRTGQARGVTARGAAREAMPAACAAEGRSSGRQPGARGADQRALCTRRLVAWRGAAECRGALTSNAPSLRSRPGGVTMGASVHQGRVIGARSAELHVPLAARGNRCGNHRRRRPGAKRRDGARVFDRAGLVRHGGALRRAGREAMRRARGARQSSRPAPPCRAPWPRARAMGSGRSSDGAGVVLDR